VYTVLVVDDEEILLNMLQRQLKSEGYDVLTALDGLSALSLARRHRPDLAILDIAMPGMDGLDLCRRLREDLMLEDLLILFLTHRDDIADRVEGLDVGGDDYLPKPFDTSELLARVRALLRRVPGGGHDAPTREQALCVGDLELDAARCTATVAERSLELTPVQLDLLYHLMSHPDQVFGADQLLVQVWGYAPGTGDTSLVRWHVKNLRDRLEPDPSNPKYLCTVPRHGYLVRSADA